MSRRTTRVADTTLLAEAAPACAVVEEVLRRTAQIYQELDELCGLSQRVARLPEVMALWFTDGSFLDVRGEPSPLRLRGRRSFSTLVRRVFPAGDVAEIARSLILARAVRKRGRFFCACSQHVSFAEDRALAQIHSLDAVHRLLGTVRYNVTQSESERRLFERSAVGHGVPVRKLPDIHARIREEARAMLHRIDDFLREHQVPENSERTVTVWLGAYEAIDPAGDTGAIAARARRSMGHREGGKS